MAFLSTHSKRKPCVVTGTTVGQQTNYAVRRTITYDSDMQTDFSDLRFTSSNGTTILPHWLESYTASTSAVAWVKVGTIPASPSTTTIYCYYDIINTTPAVDTIDDLRGLQADRGFTGLTGTEPTVICALLSGSTWYYYYYDQGADWLRCATASVSSPKTCTDQGESIAPSGGFTNLSQCKVFYDASYDGGKYVMYYEVWSGGTQPVIRWAVCATKTGTFVDQGEAIGLGSAGQFDDYSTKQPGLCVVGSTIYLYYLAQNDVFADYTLSFGVATAAMSAPGTFTKQGQILDWTSAPYWSNTNLWEPVPLVEYTDEVPYAKQLDSKYILGVEGQADDLQSQAWTTFGLATSSSLTSGWTHRSDSWLPLKGKADETWTNLGLGQLVYRAGAVEAFSGIRVNNVWETGWWSTTLRREAPDDTFTFFDNFELAVENQNMWDSIPLVGVVKDGAFVNENGAAWSMLRDDTSRTDLQFVARYYMNPATTAHAHNKVRLNTGTNHTYLHGLRDVDGSNPREHVLWEYSGAGWTYHDNNAVSPSLPGHIILKTGLYGTDLRGWLDYGDEVIATDSTLASGATMVEMIAAGTDRINCDWAFIAPYVYPEPSAGALGAEEDAPAGNPWNYYAQQQ